MLENLLLTALLKSLVAPAKTKKLSFQEILNTLAQHLNPKPILIAEGCNFYGAEQQKSEWVRQYLAKLQN